MTNSGRRTVATAIQLTGDSTGQPDLDKAIPPAWDRRRTNFLIGVYPVRCLCVRREDADDAKSGRCSCYMKFAANPADNPDYRWMLIANVLPV